jgi:uncharacterized membrane protein
MPAPHQPAVQRLVSIDTLRGLVILFMLLDHVRETFFLHMQVPDPMIVSATPPDLFFSRLLAHLCAPVFVFLTGLSAYLYASKKGQESRALASGFLWRRGLFLVILEITVINFAWTFQFPPAKLFLQVIWIIGLSMLSLAVLVWLPRRVLVVFGVALIAGHNLLDGIHFTESHPLYAIWAILHDRVWIVLSETMKARTSYPLMPWIGLIALGYAVGPWFLPQADARQRQQRLLVTACALLIGFFALRYLNFYGDKPWVVGESTLMTVMSFFNLTKYPPSLLFCAFNLGLGLLLLRQFERSHAAWMKPVAVFGSAPMFFYILHLYVLKLLYLACHAIWGGNQGELFGFDSMLAVWACWLILPFALYPAVRAFANFKARRRDLVWLKYL